MPCRWLPSLQISSKFAPEKWGGFPGSLEISPNLGLHPGKLTWNLQITHLERNMIFQTFIFGFHVNLQGFTSSLWGAALAVLLVFRVRVFENPVLIGRPTPQLDDSTGFNNLTPFPENPFQLEGSPKNDGFLWNFVEKRSSGF